MSDCANVRVYVLLAKAYHFRSKQDKDYMAAFLRVYKSLLNCTLITFTISSMSPILKTIKAVMKTYVRFFLLFVLINTRMLLYS